MPRAVYLQRGMHIAPPARRWLVLASDYVLAIRSAVHAESERSAAQPAASRHLDRKSYRVIPPPRRPAAAARVQPIRARSWCVVRQRLSQALDARATQLHVALAGCLAVHGLLL